MRISRICMLCWLFILCVALPGQVSGTDPSSTIDSAMPALESVGIQPQYDAINQNPADRADSNDTPEAATAISVPHQGDYEIEPIGDIDWYRIYLYAGDTLVIYTEAINGSQLDPELWFYGPHSESGEDVDSTNWIANDDDSHGGYQPEILVRITEIGYYYLRIAYYYDNPVGRGGEERKEGQRAETGEYRLFIQLVLNEPDILVSPTMFTFDLDFDQTSSETLIVSNTGIMPLNVTSISNTQPWLSENPSNFNVPPDSSQEVIVTVNSAGLSAGTYADTITIVSNDPDENPVTIPVVLTVAESDSDGTPEAATAISAPHQGDYEIEPVGDIDWYRIYLDAGDAWTIYTERIDDSQLDPEAWFYGPHSESGEDVDSTDWIANDDDSHGGLQPEVQVQITETGYYYLRIAYYMNNPMARDLRNKEGQRADTGEYRLFIQLVPNEPDISVSPSMFTFGLDFDQTSSETLIVSNTGIMPLNVTSISNTQPWLSESPGNFDVPPDSSQEVIVTVNSSGLSMGTYTDTITIVNNDPDENPVTIPVVLAVAEPDSDDTPEAATAISVPHQGDYMIASAEDIDWYRMQLDASDTWTIYTERIDDSQLDPEAWFYGPHSEGGEDVDSTNWIANDDDSHGDYQPKLVVVISEGGYYYLRIASFLNNPMAWGQENKEGQRAEAGEYRLIITSGVHGDVASLSTMFHLSASPNPTADRIELGIRLPAAGHVRLRIYDLMGRLMLFPLNEKLEAGYHVRECFVRDFATGTYVCRLEAGDLSTTKKILIRR